MTAKEKNGPPNGPSDAGKDERITLEEFKRMVEEARERGEDPAPIIKRLVLQVIEEVQEGLDADGRAPEVPH